MNLIFHLIVICSLTRRRCCLKSVVHIHLLTLTQILGEYESKDSRMFKMVLQIYQIRQQWFDLIQYRCLLDVVWQ